MTKTAPLATNKAVQNRRTRDLARRWSYLKKTIAKIEADFGAVSKKLIGTMKRSGRTRLPSGEDVIQLIIQRQKRPSKGDISGFFGDRQTDRFWGKLPDRISEYLTFVKEDER
jgi:hypothetical protein